MAEPAAPKAPKAPNWWSRLPPPVRWTVMGSGIWVVLVFFFFWLVNPGGIGTDAGYEFFNGRFAAACQTIFLWMILPPLLVGGGWWGYQKFGKKT